MDLIIAEKAIAGKRIATILGKGNVEQKTSQGVPYWIVPNKNAIVFPLSGHITTIDFPIRYKAWQGVDLRKLVNADIETKYTNPKLTKALDKLLSKANTLIISTDADREGENIGLEVVSRVKEVNPSLEIRRARFSAITPKDIQDAFADLGDFDFNLAYASEARRAIDLVWGAVLTRFLSIAAGRYGKSFLSAGRVQTPALALIVDKERERLAFEVTPYWVVTANLSAKNVDFVATHKKERFLDKETAQKVVNKKADTARVLSVTKRKKTLKRPIPFDTTEFLRAATALGFSASDAMSIAESLYQKGFTSYPRTDTNIYPKNLDLKDILRKLTALPEELGSLAKQLQKQGVSTPSAGGKSAHDHPPIHPTGIFDKSQMTAREWKLYELIVRRFFATLSTDAMVNTVRLDLDIAGEPFVATGQTLIDTGWKEYYPYSTLKEVILPELAKGDEAKVKKLVLEEKETKPPARYSQGSLIKKMAELGLGTKATRHEIIKKLYSRGYIKGTKSIEPTEISMSVIETLEKYSKTITTADMTAKLESEMDMVAAGKKDYIKVIQESRAILTKVLGELLSHKAQISESLRSAIAKDSYMGNCPSCGKPLVVRVSRYGKRFIGCSNYPHCKVTYPLPPKGSIQFTGEYCPECKAPLLKIKFYRSKARVICPNMNCQYNRDTQEKERD